MDNAIVEAEMKAAYADYEKRWEEYLPAREEQLQIKEDKARRDSKNNTDTKH